ncbi:hypothetical protein [Micromonospora zhanjiangensis]|uniref:Uncharacterized protein n=1 Tax=Micromonospora zhanjiangensis TaxID=1522057 RepID=A0ABV8KIU5_9ACTN
MPRSTDAGRKAGPLAAVPTGGVTVGAGFPPTRPTVERAAF